MQPCGFLLAVSGESWMIERASLNAGEWLGIDVGTIVGRRIDQVFTPDAVHSIRSRLQSAPAGGAMRLPRVVVDARGLTCDIGVHLAGSTVVIECEPSIEEESTDIASSVHGIAARLRNAADEDALNRAAVREMRALSSFDRVTLWRFKSDGTSAVLAESARAGFETPVGRESTVADVLREPPAFYERNWLRLVPDVNAPAIPIEEVGGEPLDLTMCALRGVEPSLAAHLTEMGVAASMTLSVRSQGRLWGLIACHHASPHRVAFDIRNAAELFGQFFSLLVESHERNGEAALGARMQEQREFLIAELNHRIRNLLSLMHGIVSQSRQSADSVDAFAEIIRERIAALSRAHNQLVGDTSGPSTFSSLVAAEAGAFLEGKADRVRLAGAPATLSPRAIATMALVVHEMLTNASKYGALSADAGRVALATSFDGTGRFVIDWRESGGPPVKPPTRRGFGSTVIERSIPHDLGGTATLDFAADGLRACFVLPAGLATPGEEKDETPAAQIEPQAAERALPGDLLLVEDNMIIALDMEETIRKLGIANVRTATRVDDALAAIAERAPDFALLDVNLGNETSFPIAERLAALGVPFAFATGYSEQIVFPQTLRDVARLRKPYSNEALGLVLGQRRDDRAS